MISVVIFVESNRNDDIRRYLFIVILCVKAVLRKCMCL